MSLNAATETWRLLRFLLVWQCQVSTDADAERLLSVIVSPDIRTVALVGRVTPNPAANRTLRDRAAQRRLLLRWAPSTPPLVTREGVPKHFVLSHWDGAALPLVYDHKLQEYQLLSCARVTVSMNRPGTNMNAVTRFESDSLLPLFLPNA
jgi:hypothetical protein